MNILFVYPKYPDTFWSFKPSLKFISKKASFPPLGLLTVASMVPKEWNKKLIDLNTTPLKEEDLLWADLVFISAMIVQKKSTQEIIKKTKNLKKTIVAGGPLFNSHSENFKDVDHFILNEAEITLPLFLKDLKKGKPKKIYTSQKKPDITTTPKPLWSLINFKDYSTMLVQYSRGCPFNCEFCDIVVMNGRIPRTKTPDQLIAELESLYTSGWRNSVFIVDDNFIGHKTKVKEMLRILIKWQKQKKYPFKFLTEASTNLADDQELMQLMSQANFYKVFLGIETPVIESLKECQKFQNTSRDLSQTVKIIQKHGLQVMGGFIIGFDNDPKTIFESQIRFIQKTGIVTAMVGLLSALPKTRLWHRLKAENRLLSTPTGNNIDGTLNFIPKMDKETLLNGYKKVISTLYSYKNYYRRINTFIKNYKPSVKSKLELEDIKAFFKSLWVIGILSKARFRFWHLIFKTTLTKIKSLPMAIELAIIGLHFEKISSRI